MTEASLELGGSDFRSPRDPGSLAGVRWARMALRAAARFDWSREGVRLWCVKHPELRWLPFAGSGDGGNGMLSSPLAGPWCLYSGQPAADIESDCASLLPRTQCFPECWLRGGCLDHPSSSRWRRRKEEAALAAKESDRLKVARSLLGPRGGLQSDLIKLAALPHLNVDEKNTVKTLRERMKPTIADLRAKVPAEPATSTI